MGQTFKQWMVPLYFSWALQMSCGLCQSHKENQDHRHFIFQALVHYTTNHHASWSHHQGISGFGAHHSRPPQFERQCTLGIACTNRQCIIAVVQTSHSVASQTTSKGGKQHYSTKQTHPWPSPKGGGFITQSRKSHTSISAEEAACHIATESCYCITACINFESNSTHWYSQYCITSLCPMGTNKIQTFWKHCQTSWMPPEGSSHPCLRPTLESC